MLYFFFALVSSTRCNYFICEDASRVIPSSFINDDFCDCKDGSDEPNTSACSNSVFECAGKRIPASKVMDSVCGEFYLDCCDGSDEVEGMCQNKCEGFYKKVKSERKVEYENWQRGLKVKVESFFRDFLEFKHAEEHLVRFVKMAREAEERILYLKALQSIGKTVNLETDELSSRLKLTEDVKNSAEEEVKKLETLKKTDFGPNLQFFSLFNKEFRKTFGIHEFRLTFFKKITQHSKSTYNLGLWSGFRNNYTSILFENGSPCTGILKRKTLLKLKCSEKTDLLSLTEVSPCTFEGVFSHPGACSSEFKPE